MSDEMGNIVDGDQLLAVLAGKMLAENSLKKKIVVGTSMTNLGLELWLKDHGLLLYRTSVGDRYVSEKIHKEDLSLGGEPSGHILMPQYSLTGDALINSMILLTELKKRSKPASETLRRFKPVPQVIKNINNVDKKLLEKSVIKKEILNIINEIGNQGRLVVRPSGTEPLIRIMMEGNDESLIASTIKKVESLFR